MFLTGHLSFSKVPTFHISVQTVPTLNQTPPVYKERRNACLVRHPTTVVVDSWLLSVWPVTTVNLVPRKTFHWRPPTSQLVSRTMSVPDRVQQDTTVRTERWFQRRVQSLRSVMWQVENRWQTAILVPQDSCVTMVRSHVLSFISKHQKTFILSSYYYGENIVMLKVCLFTSEACRILIWSMSFLKGSYILAL